MGIVPRTGTSRVVGASIYGDAVLTPAPGLILGGRYRVLRGLGEGGMGAVFEAENTLTFKRTAIKWLHPRLSDCDRGRRRMLREARAMSRVRHRNVVDLYDVVEEDGQLFLVMELLHGELLSERISRAPLSIAQLVRFLLPAMEGVAAAHAAGVVHRDVKSANIFLADTAGLAEPIPKVIDFGISKTFETAAEPLTHPGVLRGTPRYVSFEQLCGERDVDGRSDVYAFGVILYEALVGCPPYSAASLGEQAIQFMTTVPRAPRALRPDLPAELDALVLRAIARERAQRFPSMAGLIEALRPFAESSRYPNAMVRVEPADPLPTAKVAAGAGTTKRASLLSVPSGDLHILPRRGGRTSPPGGTLACWLLLGGVLVTQPAVSESPTPRAPVSNAAGPEASDRGALALSEHQLIAVHASAIEGPFKASHFAIEDRLHIRDAELGLAPRPRARPTAPRSEPGSTMSPADSRTAAHGSPHTESRYSGPRGASERSVAPNLLRAGAVRRSEF